MEETSTSEDAREETIAVPCSNFKCKMMKPHNPFTTALKFIKSRSQRSNCIKTIFTIILLRLV